MHLSCLVSTLHLKENTHCLYLKENSNLNGPLSYELQLQLRPLFTEAWCSITMTNLVNAIKSYNLWMNQQKMQLHMENYHNHSKCCEKIMLENDDWYKPEMIKACSSSDVKNFNLIFALRKINKVIKKWIWPQAKKPTQCELRNEN